MYVCMNIMCVSLCLSLSIYIYRLFSCSSVTVNTHYLTHGWHQPTLTLAYWMSIPSLTWLPQGWAAHFRTYSLWTCVTMWVMMSGWRILLYAKRAIMISEIQWSGSKLPDGRCQAPRGTINDIPSHHSELGAVCTPGSGSDSSWRSRSRVSVAILSNRACSSVLEDGKLGAHIMHKFAFTVNGRNPGNSYSAEHHHGLVRPHMMHTIGSS